MLRGQTPPIPQERLRVERLARGLTQYELAQQTGLTVQTVARAERMVGRPHRGTLRLLALALGEADAGKR